MYRDKSEEVGDTHITLADSLVDFVPVILYSLYSIRISTKQPIHRNKMFKKRTRPASVRKLEESSEPIASGSGSRSGSPPEQEEGG